MNRATAFNTLTQAFKTWWTTNYPAVPAAWPDLDFTPPAPGTAWMRFSLHWSGTMAAGVGSAEDRHTGMAFVELFWPSNDGFKDVNEAADAVAAYFRDYSADGGRLKARGFGDGEKPSVSTPPREQGYTRRTVNVPVRLMEPI